MKLLRKYHCRFFEASVTVFFRAVTHIVNSEFFEEHSTRTVFYI